VLKLSLSGNPGECYHFLNDLKSQRQYQVELESKEYDASSYQITRVRLKIDVKPKERKPQVVRLNTETGEQIVLNLLDGVVMQLEEGITYVT
jgi:hypothetical protein